MPVGAINVGRQAINLSESFNQTAENDCPTQPNSPSVPLEEGNGNSMPYSLMFSLNS